MKSKVKTWLLNINSGNIKSKTELVLNEIIKKQKKYNYSTIQHRSTSTNQLREKLNISHQSLTAILSNLNDEGLIEAVGEVKINNSYYSKWIFIEDLEQRKHIIQMRKDEKLLSWIRQGINSHDIPEKLKTYLTKYENYLTSN